MDSPASETSLRPPLPPAPPRPRSELTRLLARAQWCCTAQKLSQHAPSKQESTKRWRLRPCAPSPAWTSLTRETCPGAGGSFGSVRAGAALGEAASAATVVATAPVADGADCGADAAPGDGGVAYMYVFAHTLVVDAQGVLVGCHGPPEHCSVQFHPVQLATTFVGASLKYHSFIALAMVTPSTVNW